MPTLPDGTRNGPFAGVLIADLTHALSGPFCTMLLAELGARVVKIERSPAGDVARAFAPMVDGQSAYFANINRGKESIALDVEAHPDRELFRELVRRADVVVENFRPGTLERHGIPPFAASWRRAVGAMAERVASTFHSRRRPAGAIRTLNPSSRVSGNNLSSPAASTTEHALGLIVSLLRVG